MPAASTSSPARRSSAWHRARAITRGAATTTKRTMTVKGHRQERGAAASTRPSPRTCWR